MVRVSGRLTDREVRQVKPDRDGKRTLVLPDGNGLRLTITPGGRKYWQYRTAVGGKESSAQIGEYPTMGVEVARKRASELREFGRQGRNPIAEHKVAKLRNRIQANTTFEAIASELLAGKQKNVSKAHYEKVSGALRANIYPILGSIPIHEISPPILAEALRPLERRGALDYLAGVRRWVGEVFEYAKAHGHYIGDNPAHALRKNVFKKHEGGRMAALPWSEIGNFWQSVASVTAEEPTRCAVQLLVLTACRPSEIREAKWSEFDSGGARWEIPAERMKKRQMHAVPLSRQALSVLEKLRLLTGDGEFLFPSRAGSKHPCMSDMTMNYVIKRATTFPAHPHGFRSVFSTHASESLIWSDKVKEAALAHRRGGKIEGTYDRATFYQERVKLMQWYADEIDAAVMGAEVIPIPQTTESDGARVVDARLVNGGGVI